MGNEYDSATMTSIIRRFKAFRVPHFRVLGGLLLFLAALTVWGVPARRSTISATLPDGLYNYRPANSTKGGITTTGDAAKATPVTINFRSADDVRLTTGAGKFILGSTPAHTT